MKTKQQSQAGIKDLPDSGSGSAAKSAPETDASPTGSVMHKGSAGNHAKRSAVLFLALLLILSSWGGIAGAVSASAAVTADSSSESESTSADQAQGSSEIAAEDQAILDQGVSTEEINAFEA